MKIGSLVKFTHTMYREWGLGLVLREHRIMGRDNQISCLGFYYVMTQLGEKLTSDSYMEELSINPISS